MKTFKQFLVENEGGIDKVAGVGDDAENFHIKFKVSKLIKLAQQFPAKPVPMHEFEEILKGYTSGNRLEDPKHTQKRIDASDLKYPIIAFSNENDKIFAVGDGTHRLQKAEQQGLKTIMTHVIPKDIAQQNFGIRRINIHYEKFHTMAQRS